MRSELVYAAFNRKTGYVMAPTMACSLELCRDKRDKFYKGCPIYACLLEPISGRPVRLPRKRKVAAPRPEAK